MIVDLRLNIRNKTVSDEEQPKLMPNPFCGWCLYEQKCSVKQECVSRTSPMRASHFSQDDHVDSLWLSASASSAVSKCPAILSVWPSRYVNPTSSNLVKPDNYLFSLNVPLIPSVEYYCDITAGLFQRALSSQTQMTSTRVPATFVNESALRCDLMPIKVCYIFQSVIKLYIRNKKV